MHIYNVINGPKHMNLQEFIEHVEDFKHGRQKYDYIQVELGENNIQISADHEIIRQYSNPETRRLHQHIATYKKLKNPRIYIKLPTRNIDQIHKKFEFDFSHFSIKTLKCITNILQMKSNKNIQQSYLEKADYVNFISSEYSKNSTSFNMLCLTKCGTLIGYLYKPLEEKEKAFVPTKEYSFNLNDIALETSGDGNNFIVILPVKRDKIKTYTKLPFTIYPVSIIQGISSQGIYYYDVEREREVCIKWPAAPLKEKRKYANWLHEKLMEISKTQVFINFLHAKHEISKRQFVLSNQKGESAG
uniref:Uncharacterized protein n=1 Tax=Panagrolaimus davidi TaxID=227884 RepID=A0A914Q8P2_9BILA